jgi:hypothetical protein
MFSLELLPAGCGDCLWLEYGDPPDAHIVLIDGGVKATAAPLAARIRTAMAARGVSTLKIDLLVITHYDNDHIEGILELLAQDNLPVTFGDIWFNGDAQLANLPAPDGLGEPLSDPDSGDASGLPADQLGVETAVWSPADLLGAVEGEKLSELLRGRGLPWNRAFRGDAVMVPRAGKLPAWELPGGLKLTLLGPPVARLRKLAQAWQSKVGTFDPGQITVPEAPPDDLLGGRDAWPPILMEDVDSDQSPANGSSIVLLAEYREQRVLLAGDAHPGDLTAGLARLQSPTPLPLAAFKLPHHGSAHNLTREMLARIKCPRYLISTDGSKSQRHPDQQALLRICCYGGPKPLLMFNYKGDTTRNWRERQQDVLRQGFPDYDTAYPDRPGSSLLVKLS